MNFTSILFSNEQGPELTEQPEPPAFFTDLNLDQVFNSVMKGKESYNLVPYFYTSLESSSEIFYRQEVFRDLEDPKLFSIIKSFSQKMTVMRRYLELIQKLYYEHHITGWFLEAVLVYCEAVQTLSQDLSEIQLKSTGLTLFRKFISKFQISNEFVKLDQESKDLKKDLQEIDYCVIIKDSTVQIRKYENEIDYSKVVEKTFEKFKQGEVKNYKVEFIKTSGMNHVEAQILDAVAKLFPIIFEKLSEFFEHNQNFINQTIRRFDREIQFYTAYDEYIESIKHLGYKFCYPEISTDKKEVSSQEAFDIALAKLLIGEQKSLVTNDFYLTGNERIIVVSGPNQGGKTTFARQFGQLHFLASIGVPVMGKQAKLFLFDQLFTHFEVEEDIRNLRGKLQDDLHRINKILEQATPQSIIIMNEIFTSTTLNDAIFLSKEILLRIEHLDILSVCVTFIDELASLSEKTISMVSTVDPGNLAIRTFKIIRKPADGLAFALSIVEKYHLTYNSLKERIQS